MQDKKKITLFIDHLYSLNYKEKLVGIEQFISDPYFMGKSTGNGTKIYPAWKNKLKEIFSDDSKMFVVLTGAIGIGKTFIALLAIAYIIYRIENSIDPWGFFNKAPIGKLMVAFFNLTKTLSKSKGFGTLQELLLNSPWFLERGRVRGAKDQFLELDSVDYLLASPLAHGFGTQGQNIIAGIMDEVDSPLESANSKFRVLKAYENSVMRFESRFIIDGISLGKFFIVASKQDTMSFINTYVETQRKSKRTLVYDMPIYEVKHPREYSGKKFRVSIGDRYNKPKILHTDEDFNSCSGKFEIIEVPVEYQESFELDIVGALRDISGIAVSQIRKNKLMPSETFVYSMYDESRKNPFTMETVELGLNDDASVLDGFFNVSNIKLSKDIPRYIHGDWAKSGDAFGLAMCGTSDYTHINITKEDGTIEAKRMPVIDIDFILRIKARDGDEIPQFAVRKFILDLKSKYGFNIKKYSSDLDLASTDTRQLLERAGIDTAYLSVDKSSKEYISFKNAILEGRVRTATHAYFHFEITNLEIDLVTGKVDHPDCVKSVTFLQDGDAVDTVLEGSKDCCDACCGAYTLLIRSSIEDDPVDTAVMRDIMHRASGAGHSSGAMSLADKLVMVDGKKVVGTASDADKLKSLIRRANNVR